MRRAVVIALLLTFFFILVGAGLLLVANQVGPLWRPDRTDRIIPSIVLLAAILSFTLFVTLLTRGLDDYFHKYPISRLFWPMVMLKGTLAYALSLQSIGAVDRLLHDGRITWTILFDTEVRLIGAGIYVALVVAAGWQLYEIAWGIWGKRAS